MTTSARGFSTRPDAPPSSLHVQPRGPGEAHSKRRSTKSCLRPRSLVSSTGRSPGSLPEELARSLVRHRVLERIVAELAASGELERLVTAALASPKTLELTDRVLASDETQHALRHVASSPELRDAIARQTTGLADEVVGGVRASAARLDDRAEQVVRRPLRTERPIYGGIATRAIALATDAALTIVLFMSVVGIAALVASLVGGLRPEWLVGALLALGLDADCGHVLRPLLEFRGADAGNAAATRPCSRPRGRPSLDRSIARAPGRARARDRAAVRRLHPGAVHRAATRAYRTSSREPSSSTTTHAPKPVAIPSVLGDRLPW